MVLPWTLLVVVVVIVAVLICYFKGNCNSLCMVYLNKLYYLYKILSAKAAIRYDVIDIIIHDITALILHSNFGFYIILMKDLKHIN